MYYLFCDHELLAKGAEKDILPLAKAYYDQGKKGRLLALNCESGQNYEMDLRGTLDEVLARIQPEPTASTDEAQDKSGPGRPKLGVIGKEVTLLPRHWEWLNSQPGGASVTLRKLVEEARKQHASRDEIRKILDGTYRFMWVMAGDLPQFEEATRALFARDLVEFAKQVGAWSPDIANCALEMMQRIRPYLAELPA